MMKTACKFLNSPNTYLQTSEMPMYTGFGVR